jgi:serine/threonine-protein kinase
MTKFGVTLGPSPRAELSPDERALARGDAELPPGDAAVSGGVVTPRAADVAPRAAGQARRAVPLAHGATVGGVIAGKYRIERVIGHGGMGVVVAASHLALQRTVAIKLLRGDWADDPLAVERLVREARALASIQSQHVARVLDVGTLDDGIPFIVMEYLEGHDLDTLLRRDGPLPVADAIDYLVQACEALAEAHRNGIVHRDIKPANLFLARQPGGAACIKVVDFGISKLINSSVEALTHPSRIVGSLYHMAPEQISGEAVDARTDVWALGVLSFELLSGRKPFQGGAWPTVFARVLSEAEPPLESLGDHVPREVQSAVRRCLQRQPQDRFCNVAELAVALAPFGTRVARVSLEHIVRLATSTGSLAAEPLSPPPPALDTGARAGSARAAGGAVASAASGAGPGPGTEAKPSAATGPGGVALPAVAGAESLRGLPPARRVRLARSARGRGKPLRWLVVAAAALVVVGVPWWVTRLLRPAPEAAAAKVQVAPATAPAPRVERATPALLPVPSGVPVPAPGGVTPSSGRMLAPAVAEPAPSPHPQQLPPEPRVRVWSAPPPAQLPAAAVAPPQLASPGQAPAATAESEPNEAAPAVGAAAAPVPPSAPAAPAPAPRGANPWDFRDLEFE